jgi:hypothetical protein
MKQRLFQILSGFVCVTAAVSEPFPADQISFFERRIRPVLVKKCYECHAVGEKTKGGLVVDTREGIIKGGSSGSAVVLGDPDKSLLVRVLKGLEKDMEMPPKEEDRLSDSEIADFEKWVRMGLPDPRVGGKSGGPLRVDAEQAAKHWAFQPIADPVPPTVKDKAGWVQNDVDRFVLAQLEARGMQPNPIADRRTLIRRASYALTGLPPSFRDVEEFVNDPSPTAFQTVIDRLLESPHYGERWARHWMDVARFADTTGDRANRRQPRYPFAWTYRDWLIDAFNRDLPYNQFVKEQLAADKVVGKENKAEMAALGFLTIGKLFMGQADDVIDDRIDVVTQGLMGLTVSCARCHDHKFDPIPTADYYSLHGIFSSTKDLGDGEGPIIAMPADEKLYQEYLAEVERLEEEVADVRVSAENKVLTKFRGEVGRYLLAARAFATQGEKKISVTQFARKHTVDQDIFPQWLAYLKQAQRRHDPVFAPWFEFAGLGQREFSAKAAGIAARVARNEDKGKPINPTVAKAFAKVPDSLEDVAETYSEIFKSVDDAWRRATKANVKLTALEDEADESLRRVIHGKKSPIRLERAGFQRLVGVQVRNAENRVRGKIAELQLTHDGSPARAMAVEDLERPRDSYIYIRGERRNRGDRVPRRFLEILSDEEREAYPKDSSGRLELAMDIVDPENPLTTRVLVNRVWLWQFGKGLVSSPGDFGLRADSPTHPLLLDWLARKFVRDGWSLKELQRTIMLSATWQQSSLKNDAYDAVDPANDLLWRWNLQRLDFEAIRDTLIVHGGKADLNIGGRSTDLEEDEGAHRRTLYGMIDRANLPELFRIFDFANPDMTQAQRYNTTVPQQALFLMNSPIAVEEAKNIANRPEMLSEATDEEKVEFVYGQVLQRVPTSDEMAMCLRYIERQRNGGVEAPPHLAWEFGYGRFDAKTEKLERFAPLPSLSSKGLYLRDTRVSAKAVKDKKAKAYEVSMSGESGVFANRTTRALVRRWKSPVDGEIAISGNANGRTTESSVELVGMAISNRRGMLGRWDLGREDTVTELNNVKVEAGETIDFVVVPKSTVSGGYFTWAPKISMSGKDWDANRDFEAASNQKRAGGKPLNEWERFAQTMLFSNELIYLN